MLLKAFCVQDRNLIEALRFDPNASVGYEAVRGVLFWSDEVPRDITFEGRRLLHDLQTARSVMYHRLPDADPLFRRLEHVHTEMVARYRPFWDYELAAGLKWPGFHESRLKLSDELMKYFLRVMWEPV